uniref:Acyl-CoA synthetase (AMP-forming)/AMP-acid ligase II n=1 Tax=Candidatus Kentrum sp. FW TaxID=2126338 RepID=A0A450TYI3_9GAMM|nr:MAG: Acyl-CoA synthetase (AMP-forming)/AMP-acid ligase II [Candidatus Kentron sp. FW]
MGKNFTRPTTLVELLRYRAQAQPGKTAYTFLEDGETEEISLTYEQLDLRARAIAVQLQRISPPGECALLLYSAGLEFIAAFFGCLYAGVVAVPTYPPRRNRPDPRFQAIAEGARADVVLATSEILSGSDSRLTQAPELGNLHCLATDSLAGETVPGWRMPDIHSDTLALLQYTSGSTDIPKGVMVSHDNLLHNQEMIRQGFGHTEDTVGVGWLPLFHDMGLIGNVLQPLYGGSSMILMSPTAFLQRPFRWLQAISRYRGTINGGPNFAYDLCVDNSTPEQRAKLDLGDWTLAFTGAEPVRAETLDRFAKTFASCGFRREAFYPTYGMAEATLFVSGGSKSAPPVIHEATIQGNHVITGRSAIQRFVGCGHSWLDQKIVIVDPQTHLARPDRQVGEIWVSGKSVAQGYWNRTEETRQTFRAHLADTGEGPFLRTGDLGFLKEGELFVTGRIKDLIIIHGQNHYPQDIEFTVEKSHEALVMGGAAAFSVEEAGREKLVIVQEIQRTRLRKLDTKEVFDAIRKNVLHRHELAPHTILLVKPGQLPRTSSGKVRRHMCQIRFLANGLETVAKWQHSRFGGVVTKPNSTNKE